MNRHELDVVSLLAGMVFLTLGGVGLLQGAGVVDSGAPWAVIGAVAAVGLTGIVVSLRRLVPSSGEPVAETVPVLADEPPEPEPEPEPGAALDPE